MGGREPFHTPVLTNELLSWLACGPGRSYLDCTVGGGGLATRILERTGPDGHFVGIDRDGEALSMTRERLKPFGPRVHLVQGDFLDLKQHLASAGLGSIDGVVFDLGVSSGQLDQPDRGFSFLADGPLDMRMDRTSGETAAELITRLSEPELVDVIGQYGEERFARRIARAIVRARGERPLRTTRDLIEVVRRAVPAAYRHGRIHVATRTFQAIRIAVNRELEVLEPALRDAAEVLTPGGRLCVVSFHSLEDRIAKRTIRGLSQQPHVLRPLSKKPLLPSDAERARNPRARSAKLRVAERVPAAAESPG
ncbi:MAG: 16S rRNA (cytosine(1402)-N(4))-methyltransferase RsmH [Nitrospirales bacterium]